MNPRWKPSVTVAAIIERDGKFLLVEEHTQDGLRLNNPAGHLDPGESPLQACVRETLEETAFHFTPGALVGIYLSRFERAVPDRLLGACRTWGVESENRPQRGQFLPDLQTHSPAMGQKDGEKWTAAVDLQPTIPKPDRLLDITYLRFAFRGELGEHVAGQALDEGIVRTLWLTPDEIRACAHLHRSPLLLTCMEDHLAGKAYPLDLVTTDSSVYGARP